MRLKEQIQAWRGMQRSAPYTAQGARDAALGAVLEALADELRSLRRLEGLTAQALTRLDALEGAVFRAPEHDPAAPPEGDVSLDAPDDNPAPAKKGKARK